MPRLRCPSMTSLHKYASSPNHRQNTRHIRSADHHRSVAHRRCSAATSQPACHSGCTTPARCSGGNGRRRVGTARSGARHVNHVDSVLSRAVGSGRLALPAALYLSRSWHANHTLSCAAMCLHRAETHRISLRHYTAVTTRRLGSVAVRAVRSGVHRDRSRPRRRRGHCTGSVISVALTLAGFSQSLSLSVSRSLGLSVALCVPTLT